MDQEKELMEVADELGMPPEVALAFLAFGRRWKELDEDEAREMDEAGPCFHCNAYCGDSCDGARGDRADAAYESEVDRQIDEAGGR